MALKRFLKRAVTKAAGKVAAKKASTTAAKKAALLAKSKKAAKAKADFASKKAREAKSVKGNPKPALKAKKTIKVAPAKRKSTVKSSSTLSETQRRRNNRRSSSVALQRKQAADKRPRTTNSRYGDNEHETPYKTASAKGVKETPQQKQIRLRKDAKKNTTKTDPKKQKPTKKGIPFRTPLNKKPKQPALTGRVIKDTKGKLKNTSPTGNKRSTAKGTNPDQRRTGDVEQESRSARRSSSDSFDAKSRGIISNRLRDSGLRGGDPKYKKLKKDLEKRAKAGKLRVGDAADASVRRSYKQNTNIQPGSSYQETNKTGARDWRNRMTDSKSRKLSEDMTQRKVEGKLKPIKKSTNTSNGPGVRANDTKLKPQGTPKKPKSVSAKKDNTYQGRGIDPAKSASVKKGAGSNAFKPSPAQAKRGRVVTNAPSAKQLQQGNTEQFKRFNGR